MPSSENAKSQRILACVLCSQRKVKCDRKFPCINCTKARVPCVPVAPAPRQRRGPQVDKDVIERLRHYENLLERNNIGFEPFQHESFIEKGSPQVASHGREQSMQGSSPASPIVKSEAAVSSKSLWQTMTGGSLGPEFDNNPPSDGVEGTIKKVWDEAYEHHDSLLMELHEPAVDLIHPEPVQIFQMWQIFLDNVNPLIKVVHAPSMQGKIIDAASNSKNINPALEALMFSIYCMSITSLRVDQCQTKFGTSKDVLLARYQRGCRQALLSSSYLKTADRNCLTAFYLYLLSIGSRTDPRSLSSMLGIAIRIAQRMGIHSESILAKNTPFEAEMRRRLWWSLLRLDSRIGEMADYKITMPIPSWTCKVPLNINDSDLRPDMKEPPVAQTVPTEALFVVVCSEIGKLISNTDLSQGFTTLFSTQKTVLATANELTALEERLQEMYLRTCLMENPLHFVTVWTTRMFIARYRLIEHYATILSRSTTSTSSLSLLQTEAALSHAFTVLTCDTNIATSPLTKGYVWLNRFYFPFPAYVHIIQHLKKKPLDNHADHAWEIMSENYDARFTDMPKPGFALLRMFAKVILPGWEVREAALKEVGEKMVLPRIVELIRYSLRQEAENVQEGSEQQQPSGNLNFGTENDDTSMPMGFGAECFFYDLSMGGPFEVADPPVPGLYPGAMQGQLSSGVDWTAMDWSAGQGPSY